MPIARRSRISANAIRIAHRQQSKSATGRARPARCRIRPPRGSPRTAPRATHPALDLAFGLGQALAQFREGRPAEQASHEQPSGRSARRTCTSTPGRSFTACRASSETTRSMLATDRVAPPCRPRRGRTRFRQGREPEALGLGIAPRQDRHRPRPPGCRDRAPGGNRGAPCRADPQDPRRRVRAGSRHSRRPARGRGDGGSKRCRKRMGRTHHRMKWRMQGLDTTREDVKSARDENGTGHRTRRSCPTSQSAHGFVRRNLMKRLILGTVVALSALTATGAAEAKGCIKGAIVGGVAGHMAGHGVMGGGRRLCHRPSPGELEGEGRRPAGDAACRGALSTLTDKSGGALGAPPPPFAGRGISRWASSIPDLRRMRRRHRRCGCVLPRLLVRPAAHRGAALRPPRHPLRRRSRDRPADLSQAFAQPPVFARARAVALYDDVARGLVHRLKYEDRHDLARRWPG